MKEKGIKILVSIFLFASILMPFSVSADTILQSDIQGVERVLLNSTYLDLTVTNAGNTYKYYSFDYEVTVLLKDYYLGWIQGTFQTSYKTFDNADWSVQNSSCTTASKSYYVNDNKFKSSFTITAWILVNQQGNVDPAGNYSTSFTLSNSNVVAYQDLNSIDTVIDLLQDVNQYVSIDILSELQTIVTNTDISNQYLKVIADMRLWNIPIESFNFITNFYYKNFQLLNYSVYQNYPIFIVPDGSYIFNGFQYAGTYTMIFLISDNITANTREEWIKINNLTFSQIQKQTLNGIGFQIEGKNAYFLKLTYTLNSAQNTNIQVINTYHSGDPYYMLPIYFGRSDNKLITTDFALNWGLTNNLLDNLQIIAQGTQQSNSAASGLESDTNQMQSDFNSYYSIENTANSDFNSALNGINFNDQIAGNQSFLDSASFVKIVFSSMMQIPILSTFVIILCIILMARIFL